MSTIERPSWARPGAKVIGTSAGRSFAGEVVLSSPDDSGKLVVYVETTHARRGEPHRIPVTVDPESGHGLLDWIEPAPDPTTYEVTIRRGATSRTFTFTNHAEAVAFGQGISHGLMLVDPMIRVSGEMGDYTAILADATVLDIALHHRMGGAS